MGQIMDKRKWFCLAAACFGVLTACLFFLQLRTLVDFNFVHSMAAGLHIPYHLCYALFFTLCLIACASIGVAGLYQLFTDDTGSVDPPSGTQNQSPCFRPISTVNQKKVAVNRSPLKKTANSTRREHR